MTSPLVSRSEALKRRTHHQFLPGFGYIAHSGPPEVPVGIIKGAGKNCNPPPDTGDGSLHLLRPPNRHPDMVMRWIAKHSAWAPVHHGRGNRLAWAPSHLSSAGWEYQRPMKSGEPDPSEPVEDKPDKLTKPRRR